MAAGSMSSLPAGGRGGGGRGMAGILDMHIVAAEGVRNRCPYGPQDVYARVLCGAAGGALHTRTVKHAGACPVFNQRLQVGIPEGETAVKCELWMASHNRGTADDQLLACTQISIDGLLLGKTKSGPMEFPLVDEDGGRLNCSGCIRISLSYHPRLQGSGGSIGSQQPSRGSSLSLTSSLSKALAGALSTSRSAPSSRTSKRCSPEPSFESPRGTSSDHLIDSEVQSPCMSKRNRSLSLDLEALLRSRQREDEGLAGTTPPIGSHERSFLKLGSLCLPDIDVDFSHGDLHQSRGASPSPASSSPSRSPSPNGDMRTAFSVPPEGSLSGCLSRWERAGAEAPLLLSGDWGEEEMKADDEDDTGGKGQPPLAKVDCHYVSLREGLGPGEELLGALCGSTEQANEGSVEGNGEFQFRQSERGERGGGVEADAEAGTEGLDSSSRTRGSIFFMEEEYDRPQLPDIEQAQLGLLAEVNAMQDCSHWTSDTLVDPGPTGIRSNFPTSWIHSNNVAPSAELFVEPLPFEVETGTLEAAGTEILELAELGQEIASSDILAEFLHEVDTPTPVQRLPKPLHGHPPHRNCGLCTGQCSQPCPSATHSEELTPRQHQLLWQRRMLLKEQQQQAQVLDIQRKLLHHQQQLQQLHATFMQQGTGSTASALPPPISAHLANPKNHWHASPAAAPLSTEQQQQQLPHALSLQEQFSRSQVLQQSSRQRQTEAGGQREDEIERRMGMWTTSQQQQSDMAGPGRQIDREGMRDGWEEDCGERRPSEEGRFKSVGQFNRFLSDLTFSHAVDGEIHERVADVRVDDPALYSALQRATSSISPSLMMLADEDWDETLLLPLSRSKTAKF